MRTIVPATTPSAARGAGEALRPGSVDLNNWSELQSPATGTENSLTYGGMSSLVERWCRVHGRGGSPQHLRRAALRLLSVVCTFVVFCAGDGNTMRVQQPWAGVRDERLMPTSRQPSRRDFSSLPRLRGGGFVYEQSLNFSAFRLAWPNASIYR